MSQEHESVDLVGDATVRHIALASVLAALTAAFAYVSIPLPGLPGPDFLPGLRRLLRGTVAGPALGRVLDGVVRACWRRRRTGVLQRRRRPRLPAFGPTGGYIVSWVVAAVVIGLLVHRGLDPRPLSSVPLGVQAGALVAGVAVIYAIGVSWLAVSAGYDFVHAATVGAAIFLPGT